MNTTLNLLDHIRIASPCPASWAAMAGDERVRFCLQCEKNVYNLSSMTKEAAEALIVEKEGRLCARFYQRADGTILTADCPVGLRAARWAAAKMAGAVAALLGILLPVGSAIGGGRSIWASRLRTVQPFKVVSEWMQPWQMPGLMGDVCLPPPPSQQITSTTSTGGAVSPSPQSH